MTQLLALVMAMTTSLGAVAATETKYVQSKLAQVYAKPAFSAQKIITLSYGSEVELIGENKSWANIRVADQQGWVAKMVLASVKPLPKTELDADVKHNDRQEHNKARKRASVRATAAATRGLSGNFRQRSEELQRDSNYSALEKVEQLNVEEKDVLEFNQSLSQ